MATNSSDNVVHLDEVIVAMVPFPDFSHLNQLFVLARFIASHNIPVYFLCLADHNQDLKLCVQGGLGSSNIHFRDLFVPREESEDAGDGLPPIVTFMKKLIEPIQRICLELATNAKRLVIIHDSIKRNHIGDVHSLISNVESHMFHCISAFARYFLLLHSNIIDDDDHETMIQQMQDEFPLLESCGGPYVAVLLRKEHELNLNSGEIVNSCREVEEFLDKQDVNSVIFVSFGTTTTFSQEQVNEIALGFEQSNHKFIWVLREADKKMETEKFEEKDGKIELQKGFEERVEGRGMVVRNWAPQLEILGHSSTGGFLSHCGWNSCLESISMGVPLAAWPINHDQPFNAFFVTNLLKIGTPVRSWARREELVTASTIEKAVKTLMGTTEGEEMRQRAAELSNKVKSSVSRGRPARKEMEYFISRIIK
ncbi:hypothetical protein RND71_036355 [Anisodus tanguticus]|uniref:Glycosyltransferase n=1 Tax=Anisodus tanguticus TaxID=243964 RepID=A0AAE1R1H7_9SOLA|nr:hypothetical protein RND71_036355 [Anisodus tanguticus]